MHIDLGTSVNRNPRRSPPLEFKFCQAVQHYKSAEIILESAWWKSQQIPVIRLFLTQIWPDGSFESPYAVF